MKTRREFLRSAGLGAATGAAWLSGWRPSYAQSAVNSRVIEVSSETVQREHLVDGAALRQMLAESVQSVMKTRTVEAAWRRLVEPNDVVAIKVSADAPNLSTHHALVDEIVRSVVSVDVSPENIIIWDKRSDDLYNYAYTPKPLPDFGFEEPGIQTLGSEGREGQIRRVGYDENSFIEVEEDHRTRRDENGAFSYFSRVISTLATRVISVPVLRYHPVTGVHGALASLALGALNNTFRFHPKSEDGMPMIADAWKDSPLSEKHAITIVDGLVGAFNTGPGYDSQWLWQANRLFVSRDPVALDRVLLGAINAQRRSPLRPINRQTGYLRRAASLEVGVNDTDEIDHETLEIS